MFCARVALMATLFSGVALSGCRARPAPSTRPPAAPPIPPVPTSSLATSGPDEAPARELRRCFPERPTWSDAPVSDLLDRAGNLFDRDDFGGALACAEEAARAAPKSVEAHHDRAAALLHLGRLDEARDALGLALALGPDDPET